MHTTSKHHGTSTLTGAVLLSAMFLLSTLASAGTLTYDITPGSVGAGNGTITGGTGTWNLTNGNWTTNAGATNVVWANTNADEAIFGGTGGTVTVNTGMGITANKLTFNGDGYTVNGNAAADVITLAGTTPTIGVTTAGDFAYISAILAGSAELNKTGAGRLALGGVNTYTGQTTVSSGVMVINRATSLGTIAGGTVVAAGATLDLNGNNIAVGAESLTIQGTGAAATTAALQSNNVGNSSWAGVVTLAAATTIGGNQPSTSLTLSNTVTGAFPLTKVGPNTLILSGANTYTGNTTVSSGTLEISNGGTINSNNNAATVTVAAGATILLSGTEDNAIGFGGVSGGAGTQEQWIVAGAINSTGGHHQSLPVGGVTLNGGMLTGVATTTLNGTYYGNGFQGVITANGTGNLLSAASVGLISPLILNTPLAADILSASSEFQDGIVGFVGSIVKNGAGTLTLSGASTYSGSTTVNAGRLLLNNIVGSGSGSGAVTVNAGGTLGGTGSVSGVVTVNAGGHVSPGNSVGSLDVGSLALKTGSILDFELGAHSDLINVTSIGGLTLGGGSVVLTNADGFTIGTYRLIDYSGTLGGAVANLGTPIGPAGFTYALSNNTSGTSIDLIVSSPCDLNADGRIDGADVGTLYSSWGVVPPGTLADKNHDGVVDGADLGAIFNNWTGDTEPTASVPEPAMLGALSLSTAILLALRNRNRSSR